ncbi:hypothetical protein AB205_0188260 [Aquarana catesbeiana]|uniref:Uncharacterized protein n=1 Tax=Aquarana catesbeiana TaxID=8400 RepID=A0A2G9QEI0_AQUCT|nr:hypothetical protein AB205_0188260 [Aquarana catesbeiana]
MLFFLFVTSESVPVCTDESHCLPLFSHLLQTFLLHFAGPPVNVTCNIFINSFGSVTETTMVLL